MRKSQKQLDNIRRAATFAALKHPSSNRFTPEEAAELQKNLLGSVVLASSEGYDHMRQDFLRTYQAVPQIICYCEVPRDVQICLAFADAHELTPVCRSGGHSTAGYSVNDQMVIDVSRISYVAVDETSRTARVGAGTNFAKLNAELTPYKLHVPGGGCPSVCVAGFMQGGGYGFTSQMYGMNCDNVIECRVALADGTIVTANDRQHRKLFWALRGGTGNNFGVLLEITYRLHELDEIWGFGMTWPLETEEERQHAAQVLETWQNEYTGANAHPDMGTQLFIVDLERENPAALGTLKPELVVRGMYKGDHKACAAALEALTDLCHDPAKPFDIWESGSYEYLNMYLMSYPTDLPNVPMNVRAVVESRIIADPLRTSDWSTLIDYFLGAQRGALMIAMESYGGAINVPEPDEMAFEHRNALMDLFVWSFWMYESDRSRAEVLVEKFRKVVDPLSNGRAYQNYPNRSTPKDAYGELYWGNNYRKLQKVKLKYDPKPLFQYPQMVRLPDD
jgi:FAD/FMN-containing dehydrogenase